MPERADRRADGLVDDEAQAQPDAREDQQRVDKEEPDPDGHAGADGCGSGSRWHGPAMVRPTLRSRRATASLGS